VFGPRLGTVTTLQWVPF